MSGKVRTAIVRGGPSDEFDVSMKTGASVLRAIDRERYSPIDVIITRSGEWLVDGVVRYPEKLIPTFDVVFIALHGAYGEDGTIQRLFDRFGVPYTGSGPYASGIAMHKALTKEYVRHTSIKLPKHVTFSRKGESDTRRFVEQVRTLFGPHYVIKPIASGSSVGTILVDNPLSLHTHIDAALQNHDHIMIEERIVGREATCGVVERFRGQTLYALPPIEIIPPDHAPFFTLEVKYDGSTREICPSTFTHETKRAIEDAAKLVHRTLGLSQYSRSDFIVAQDGIYFLEVNTLPGLTETSLLPKALEAVGSPYTEFIGHILEDALSGKVVQSHDHALHYV